MVGCSLGSLPFYRQIFPMKHFIYLPILFVMGCTPRVQKQTLAGDANEIAFPGAQGFGKYTTGGRGGKVRFVSNLNDDGEGSLRNAVKGDQPKMVVFEVSGTIHLSKALNISANTTIAGHSAPGDGVCLADHSVNLMGDNIIVRYLRFRMGDRYQNQGMVNGAGGDDALGAQKRKHIIIDHCSLSWSTDEVLSIYNGDSTTLQWNLIAEPLNYSYHFETGDKDFEQHGFGGIWGGKHLTGHHNLFAHCNNRTPRFNGIRQQPTELVDFRNNVIYNWGTNNVYAGEGGSYNIVNNYYKYGPSTRKSVQYRVANPYKKEPSIPFGKYFINGNFIDGSVEVSTNNWLGVVMNDGTIEDAAKAKVDVAFMAADISTQPAQDAYEAVLKQAGASYRRDTLDERIIQNVVNRTGSLIDVQGGLPHGTAYEKTTHAWPALKSTPAPKDTDRDGIPDEWEKKHGLDATNATDGSLSTLSKVYSNIEVYLNSLLK